MAKPRVAILGLGIGGGMAARLLSAGFQLSVYNRSRERAASLDGGAFVAASPSEAAARSEVVISMVADYSVSRIMWLGEQGALAGEKPNSLLPESGTLSVDWVKELAAAAAQKNCEFSGCP